MGLQAVQVGKELTAYAIRLTYVRTFIILCTTTDIQSASVITTLNIKTEQLLRRSLISRVLLSWANSLTRKSTTTKCQATSTTSSSGTKSGTASQSCGSPSRLSKKTRTPAATAVSNSLPEKWRLKRRLILHEARRRKRLRTSLTIWRGLTCLAVRHARHCIAQGIIAEDSLKTRMVWDERTTNLQASCWYWSQCLSRKTPWERSL